jgi:hypothetical protein
MPIGVTRLVGFPDASQELGPGRVQVAAVVETESVDDPQAGLCSYGLGDGDGAVEFHDGRASSIACSFQLPPAITSHENRRRVVRAACMGMKQLSVSEEEHAP